MRETLRRLCKGLGILFSRTLDRTIGTPPATSYVVNVSRLLKNAKAPDHAYIRRVYVLDWLLGKD